jgi:hypothetical protein
LIQQTLVPPTLAEQYGPLASAARALIESQEPNDANRVTVNLEALKALAIALDHPLDAGKGLLTLATIDKGNLLAEFNQEIRKGALMLKAGEDGGEGKIQCVIKMARKGYLTKITGFVGLTGFKQERSTFLVDAQLDDKGALRPYDSAGEAGKIAEDKPKKKPRQPKGEVPPTEPIPDIEQTPAPLSQFERIEAEAKALSDGLAVGASCRVFLQKDGESTGETLDGIVAARSTGKVWVAPEGGGEQQAFSLEQVEPRQAASVAA